MRNHAKTVRLCATGVSAGYSVILSVAGVDIAEDLRRLVAYLENPPAARLNIRAIHEENRDPTDGTLGK